MPALPKPTESNFLPPPAGAHPAACFRVIDLGTQDTTYKGTPKKAHKVLITWELFSEERMNDGRPFSVGKSYTWSMHEKSALRKDLEMWRGKPFAESDFGEGGFDIRKLLGAPCLLTVMHETRDSNTYANVAGVTKMPKGMVVGAPSNETVFLWLSAEEFDKDVFEKLSDKLKDTIRKSPEYRAAIMGEPPPAKEDQYSMDPNDEIPF